MSEKVAEPGPSCREAWERGVGLRSIVGSADFVFFTGMGLSQYVLLGKRVLWMLFLLEICTSEYPDQQMDRLPGLDIYAHEGCRVAR